MQDYFLIWEPRDIVGGDFFWLHRSHRGYFIIIGDCTGHGVPGAFMTLIACGLLDRHLRSLEEPSPAAGAGLLHRDLQTMLGQDQRGREGETDDGFDAGVCFVSRPTASWCLPGRDFSLWRAHDGSDRGDQGRPGRHRLSPRAGGRHVQRDHAGPCRGRVVLHDDRRADRTDRRRAPPLLRTQALHRGHCAHQACAMAEQRECS